MNFRSNTTRATINLVVLFLTIAYYYSSIHIYNMKGIVNNGTLVSGLWVKEHTFKNGTVIQNQTICLEKFNEFAKPHVIKGKDGLHYINLKQLPKQEITDNKLSHVTVLNDFFHKEESK